MEIAHIKRSNSNPGALLNTDIEGLKAYKLRKKALAEQGDRLNTIEQKIDDLNAMFSTILDLLKDQNDRTSS